MRSQTSGSVSESTTRNWWTTLTVYWSDASVSIFIDVNLSDRLQFAPYAANSREERVRRAGTAPHRRRDCHVGAGHLDSTRAGADRPISGQRRRGLASPRWDDRLQPPDAK